MLAKFEAQRSKKPLCTDAGLFKFYTSRRSHRHTISYELFQGVAPSLWQKFDDLVPVTTWNPDLALSRLVVPAALFPQAFISIRKPAMVLYLNILLHRDVLRQSYVAHRCQSNFSSASLPFRVCPINAGCSQKFQYPYAELCQSSDQEDGASGCTDTLDGLSIAFRRTSVG